MLRRPVLFVIRLVTLLVIVLIRIMLLKALKSNSVQFVYLSLGKDVLFLEEDSNVDVRQTVHLFALIAMKLVILLVIVLRRRVKRLLLKVHLLK